MDNMVGHEKGIVHAVSLMVRDRFR
jgi:hypothetical protein